ncbi:MAG: hypothetical protein K6E29_07715 [Cyanobacteria bacterium RUI128]|nr:hypothetical protein [Cyanobacteria bacterium RUI128]
MNLRTGLKTMAVAIPMALAPMKSTAQQVVKESANKVSEVVVQTVGGTKVLRGAEAEAWMANMERRVADANAHKYVRKSEPLIVNGKVGAGYGATPFMDQGVAEPKLYGSLGLTNNQMKLELDANVGKAAQSYTAKVGGIVNTHNPNLGLEAGSVFRYNRFGSDIKGAVLEADVQDLATNSACGVAKYKNNAFWGAYVNPSYKFGKAEVSANAEAGVVGFAGIKKEPTVARDMVPQAVADGMMYNRNTFNFGANVGAGASYELIRGLRLGGDIRYSTFDRHAGFDVKATYEFGKNIRK